MRIVQKRVQINTTVRDCLSNALNTLAEATHGRAARSTAWGIVRDLETATSYRTQAKAIH